MSNDMKVGKMSVTLTALRDTSLISPKKVKQAPLAWQFVIVRPAPYNEGINENSFYSAEQSNDYNVGNWTYYAEFVEWLLGVFPELRPFNDALQTYTINSNFCSKIASTLNSCASRLPTKNNHNKEYINTFKTIKHAFNFAGRRGIIYFE